MMTEIAIPTLLYLEMPQVDFEKAGEAGESVRLQLDTEDGFDVEIAPGLIGTIRPNLDGDIEPIVGYRTPEGGTDYQVSLRLTVDGEDEAPDDWPDDDAQPGDYHLDVKARNIYEAIEEAKDEFHEGWAIRDLDRIELEVISVVRS